jgi:DNA integrity scanning protein DisA with diadenylate cyclase activity
VKILTRSLVRHAHAIAREVGARVVLLYADVIEEDKDLSSLIDDVNFRVILVSRRSGFVAPPGWGDLCAVVRVPDLSLTRAGQVKVAILVAAAEGLVTTGDRVVCLTGVDGSNAIDMILVLDLGAEIEMFANTTVSPLPADVAPAVFERLLTLASELGIEGREGKPVGTLFILGDTERVLAQSRQLVINPFKGYGEHERNVLDPKLEETIKEFSAIDGAFIVRGDGVLLSAARYLIPTERPDQPLPHGLGARHEAAIGITASTDALALAVSQSTGTVSIYKSGRLLVDIQKPRSRSPTEL